MVGDEHGEKTVVKLLGDQLVRSGTVRYPVNYCHVGTKCTVKNAIA